MVGKKSRSNPFHVPLVIFGIAFSLTACAYGVMAFRAVRGADVAEHPEHHAAEPRWMDPSGLASERSATEPRAGQALLTFLDEHGALLLGVELALLAAATLGVIGGDGYWNRATSDRSSVAPEAREGGPSRSNV
ncbi:MAG TPA: hypothetical protein VMV69_13565 [Pirellulales bacterium]|nr:hypothetical protein [Pirellulales bacterium]